MHLLALAAVEKTTIAWPIRTVKLSKKIMLRQIL